MNFLGAEKKKLQSLANAALWFSLNKVDDNGQHTYLSESTVKLNPTEFVHILLTLTVAVR